MSRVQFVVYQLFSPGFQLRLLWRKFLWGESEIKFTVRWIAGVIRFGTIDSSVEIYITIGKNTRDLFLGLLLHILYRLVVNFYLFRVLSASNPFQALRTQGLIIWSICKHYDCVVTNIQKWTMIYSTNLLDLLRRVWWDRLAWFVLCTSFFNPNFTRPVNIFGSNILSVLNKLHVFWRWGLIFHGISTAPLYPIIQYVYVSWQIYARDRVTNSHIAVDNCDNFSKPPRKA